MPYSSRHLTDLANEAGYLSRQEQSTTARAKNLFVKLQGDSLFAPAALAAMPDVPFEEPWSNGIIASAVNGERNQTHDVETQETIEDARDVEMEDAAQANGVLHHNGTNGDSRPETINGAEPVTNGTSHDAGADKEDGNREDARSPAADDASDTASQQTAHRMTTRARANAASTPSPPHSPSGSTDAIHPLFTFSVDSLPDRDFGLPPNEAEETRMLLMAYVQKQDEVARITSDLYQGMLQADRMRQDVFKSCKAEAHLGEMSDGEDWYDKKEWKLDQDLMKGRDEEEDDTAVAGKKSTRQRRKPDKEDR